MKGTRMKKLLSAVAIFALVAGVNVAEASDGNGKHKGNDRDKVRIQANGDVKARFGNWFKWDHDNNRNDKFVAVGTVTAKTASTLTLDVQADNREEIGDSLIVTLNGDTKYRNGKDNTALADIAIGAKVVASGKLENSVYTASSVHVMPAKQPKVMGQVTAVTDTSVTVKNNVTGEEKVVALEPDTKVVVNGEVATAADIEVGDKGWIKLKANVSAAVAKVVSLFR